MVFLRINGLFFILKHMTLTIRVISIKINRGLILKLWGILYCMVFRIVNKVFLVLKRAKLIFIFFIDNIFKRWSIVQSEILNIFLRNFFDNLNLFDLHILLLPLPRLNLFLSLNIFMTSLPIVSILIFIFTLIFVFFLKPGQLSSRFLRKHLSTSWPYRRSRYWNSRWEIILLYVSHSAIILEY